MSTKGSLPLHLRHWMTEQSIASEESFTERSRHLRDEIKSLTLMLAAAIESNGGELRIDDRAMKAFCPSRGCEIEVEHDRYNRVTILRAAK